MSSFSGVMPKLARSIRASSILGSSTIISARSFSTISRLQPRNQPIARTTTTSSLLFSKRAFSLSDLNPFGPPHHVEEIPLSPLVPADIGDNLPPSSFTAIPPTPSTEASSSIPSSSSSASTSLPTTPAPTSEFAAPNVESPISLSDIEAYTATLPASPRNLAPASPNLPFMPPKGTSGVSGDEFFDPVQITDLAHVDIQIGDLKAMGLNGWFPTRAFQSIIEYIHVFTGLPWWATIILATIAVRSTVAPLMVGNFRKSGNMVVAAPQTKIYTDAMKKAKDDGDMATMQAINKELQDHWKRNDCSPLSSLLFPVVSIPLFMTMFFSVRAMANLPVPQLTVGGIPGWCYDLTAADPTFILPVLAATMTALSLHLGVSGISPRFQPGNQQAIAGVMKYVSLTGIPVFGGFTIASWFPLIGGFSVAGFPAALVLYWATSNTFQVAQSLFLRSDWARTRFRLPPTPTEETLGRPLISDWEAIKAGWKQLNDVTNQNASKALREAKDQQSAIDKKRAAGGSNTTSLDPEVALQQKREARAAFEKASKEREEMRRAQLLKSAKTLSEVVGGSGAAAGGGAASLGSRHVVKGAGGDAQGWTSTSTKKTSSAVRGMPGSTTKPVVGAGVRAGTAGHTELEVMQAKRKRFEEELAAAKASARAKGKK